MLQLLETGKALYVLAAVCILSLAGKLITRNLYKRLIKETDNMTLTKNKYLRTLKQKTENTYRVNQGISNTRVYLEKQLYGFRFMGLSLNGWSGFSTQMTLLCFLAGCVGAFAAYWYRLDSYYIVLYGATGIMTGLLCTLFESGNNVSEKRQQLLVSLQDYMENTFFGRLDQGRTEEPAPQEITQGRTKKGRASERAAVEQATTAKRPLRGRREPEPMVEASDKEDASRRDVDYLKRSLEQIAAGREKNRSDDNWVKDLNPEEIKVIGDILREYLV